MNTIKPGDTPAIFLLPTTVPSGTTIPASRIHITMDTELYLLVRDLVIARHSQEIIASGDEAIENLMTELLKYRPRKIEQESDDLPPFDLDKWWKDGRTQP